MSERHEVTDTPFGSPEAGPVRVLSVDAEDGTINVRYEDPWESDLAPGKTLPAGRTKGTDPVAYESGDES